MSLLMKLNIELTYLIVICLALLLVAFVQGVTRLRVLFPGTSWIPPAESANPGNDEVGEGKKQEETPLL